MITLGWREHAACRGHEPEWWSLVDGRGTGNPVQFAFNERARAICATCPVMKDCKQYGYDSGAIGVILGGFSFTARRNWDITSETVVFEMEVRCGHCKQPFQRRTRRQKYCTTQCAERAAGKKHRERVRRGGKVAV